MANIYFLIELMLALIQFNQKNTCHFYKVKEAWKS